MLNFYIKSVILYFIILIATQKMAKWNMKERNIDLKKYIKNTNKNPISLLTISFIPILRFIFFIFALFFTFADENLLDKLLLNKEDSNDK